MNIETLLSDWLMAAVFAGSGLAVLARAWKRPTERIAWGLLGIGLVIFSGGGIAYNLLPATTTFPATSDLLWLSMYPFAIACLVTLAHNRFIRVDLALCLDGAIAAGGAAAVVAAAAFGSAYSTAANANEASVGLLA
ncbi:MAG: hypothetical protein ABWZ63_02465 [Thermoleophilaceae bacterium]